MVHVAPTTKKITSTGYARLLLDNVIRLHGFPKAIISDRDPRFTSKFYTALFDLCGTKLKFSTSFHPQTDGQSERANRTLEEVLRAYIGPRQNDWDVHLATAEFAINSAVSPSTGTTPFYANYGYHPATPLDLASQTVSVPAAADVRKNIADITSLVRTKLQEAQDRQQRTANVHRRPASFSVGDQVLLSTANLKLPSTLSNKFKQRFVGHFKIVAEISPVVTFELELPGTLRVHPVFHVSLLRPYNAPGPEQSNAERPAPIFEHDVQWKVDTLLDKRIVRGTTQYLVRWEGFGPEDDSWVPARDVSKDLIVAFAQRAQ